MPEIVCRWLGDIILPEIVCRWLGEVYFAGNDFVRLMSAVVVVVVVGE